MKPTSRPHPRAVPDRLFLVLLMASFTFLTVPEPQAADWPAWRGPDQDGISRETAWRKILPAAGTPALWQTGLGTGCGSVVVARGKLYSMGNIENRDYVYCLDAMNGREIWKDGYACQLDPNMYEGGPGGTPLIAHDRVYTVSREGHLRCYDAASGQVIWKKNINKEYGCIPPSWGFTSSPILENNQVLLNTDRCLSFNPETGSLNWKSAKYGSGYASILGFDFKGQRQIAMFNGKGLTLLDAVSGKEILTHPYDVSYDVAASMPIVRDDLIFISAGYGVGSELLKYDGSKVERIWRTKHMKNKFASSVLVGNHLYGFDESRLRCVEFSTGMPKWHDKGTGMGTLTAADGHLIVLSERGEVLIAEISPEAFTVKSRLQLLDERCWVVPALSNGLLYCKDNGGELVCLDLRMDEEKKTAAGKYPDRVTDQVEYFLMDSFLD
jgi:outer membrane protein assembly factor BamB